MLWKTRQKHWERTAFFAKKNKYQKLRKLKSLRQPASGVFSTFCCINWIQVEKTQKSPEAGCLKLVFTVYTVKVIFFGKWIKKGV